MDFIKIGLSISILLCALVAGLVFAFTMVVMPGIRCLGDHDFLQAFKAMDRVIQNNPPIFIFVWLGSAVAVLVSSCLGWWKLEGADRLILLGATLVYLFGVQLPTVTINIPMNNQLQRQDLDAMDEHSLHEARERFEHRWIWWNAFRTVCATITLSLLVLLVMRL